ncbi:MAG: c-type cytochrome biogenesis protein CcmI/CycH, partial [Pseudobdellovibrio sp.]
MNFQKIKLAVVTGLLLVAGAVHAEISGTVDIAKEAKSKLTEKGVLFVFARGPGDDGTKGMPPVAVLRIPNPQFPQAFTLTEANVMMPGAKFEGKLNVSARYSPSGDA